jgi:dihydroneopterin aldolase
MTDRLALMNMRFSGKHGILPEERETAQPFEVDVELYLDLSPAGRGDDLSKTVDYREVFSIVGEIVQGRSFRLIEAVAETIASRLLAEFSRMGLIEVLVRVRKPKASLPGEHDGSEVEIRRCV